MQTTTEAVTDYVEFEYSQIGVGKSFLEVLFMSCIEVTKPSPNIKSLITK